MSIKSDVSLAARRSWAIHVLARVFRAIYIYIYMPTCVLSGFVRACSSPRIIRDTCRLLPPSGIRRALSREHCRLDRMSPRSFLGNSVTFLVTPLPYTDI